jgi:hypothetical protein
MCQHRHRCFALLLFAVFISRGHISLAGIKLSMILDNLIRKRHDRFVTAG